MKRSSGGAEIHCKFNILRQQREFSAVAWREGTLIAFKNFIGVDR